MGIKKDLRIECRAKINLSLEILGKRLDNYHEICSIMQSISLSDRMYFEMNDIISVKMDKNIVDEKDNIVYKAAKLFFNYTKINSGCNIVIEKNIPWGAGLAGGSTNAAGTLYALDYLYDTNLTKKEMDYLAKQLGADVVFCLYGGTMLSKGIGENLERLRDIDCNMLLIKPEKSINTKEAFSLIEKGDYNNGENTQKMVKLIGEGEKIYDFMHNSMYGKSKTLVPEIEEIIFELENTFGCNKAMMSGSGSAVFGVYESEADLKKAYNHFSKLYSDVFITKTTNSSIEEIK